jgi:putative sigma-54 modulation protein
VKIQVRSVNLQLDARTRAEVERKVRAALGRLSPHIQRVVVRVADRNGPRGGEDIACAVEIRVRPHGAVFVEETDIDLAGAVSQAAETAAVTLVRTLQRSRDVRRKLNPKPALGAGEV